MGRRRKSWICRVEIPRNRERRVKRRCCTGVVCLNVSGICVVLVGLAVASTKLSGVMKDRSFFHYAG